MESLDFSKIFHQSSKNRFRGRQVPSGRYQNRPLEWRTTYYKAYPRLPKIELEDNPPSADFFELIRKRRSQRDFSRRSVSKQELSLILKYSCGNTGPLSGPREHRAQPSGGARFPIEVYPLVFRSGAGLETGLYHYNVRDHKLDFLWEREFGDEDIDRLFSYSWVKDAALALVLTAVFWRNQNKYGERGYRMILQESGHIGQNIYLLSGALGLGCSALSGTRDENLEKLLDIDGLTESVVYALAIGK